MKDRNVVCYQCRSAVPVDDIQYVAKGTDQYTLLCTSCIAHPGKAKKNVPAGAVAPVGAAAQSTKSFAPVSASKGPAQKLSVGETLVCTRCKYQFKYKPSQAMRLHCPYCSKDDRVERYKLDSQSLLDELREIEESKGLRDEEF